MEILPALGPDGVDAAKKKTKKKRKAHHHRIEKVKRIAKKALKGAAITAGLTLAAGAAMKLGQTSLKKWNAKRNGRVASTPNGRKVCVALFPQICKICLQKKCRSKEGALAQY